jgi:hypothetical protein
MHLPLERESSFRAQGFAEEDDQRPVKQKIVITWCLLLAIGWVLSAALCAFDK